MRSKLERAHELAGERKLAVFGQHAGGVAYSQHEFGDRAMFSGFDLDYDELSGLATRVGRELTAVYAGALLQGAPAPLAALFTAAYSEGLLHGLLAATLPDDDDQEQDHEQERGEDG